ncbi:MAG: glycosyltransferase [Pseudomonadota bacterium]
MRLLYFNWVDYLDPEGRGGGVSIYQRNVIESLSGAPDIELTFLCAGLSHDPVSTAPRWQPLPPGRESHAARRFELVNSGTLAASHNSFGHETQVDHPETRAAFFAFLEAEGPFDIVHFNNLEGLPASVMTLKERFPETRIVYSIHNYYAACPQVNLWHQERETCVDFEGGLKCATCLPREARTDAETVRRAFAVAETLKSAGLKPGQRGFDLAFRLGTRLAKAALPVAALASPGARDVAAFPQRVTAPPQEEGPFERLEPAHARYERRRREITQLINSNADLILAVSTRAGEVASRFGLDRSKIAVEYIGTKHAELFRRTRPARRVLAEDGTLTLGYLGYMRRDKGFYFLLDALEDLPSRMAAKLHLVFAARAGAPEIMARLKALGGRFASVSHADGYSHATLDEVLERVDVGLIPVMWEDNLPQVAIEMHARHIPLVTANLGGASELGNSPPMTFEAGNIHAFRKVISDVLAERVDFDTYWLGARAPVSLDTHRDRLLAHYNAIMGIQQYDEPAETNEPNLDMPIELDAMRALRA